MLTLEWKITMSLSYYIAYEKKKTPWKKNKAEFKIRYNKNSCFYIYNQIFTQKLISKEIVDTKR